MSVQDISESSIGLGIRQSKKLGINIEYKLGDAQSLQFEESKFDFVISNPPYIKINDLNNLSKEVHFDPLISLEAGVTGLRSYFEIAKNVHKHIKKDGFIILEIGKGQLKEVDKIFSNQGFRRILKEKDLQGIDRVVVYQYKSTKIV